MTNLEKLDTLPGLRAELAREREARWQAERELTAWRAETGAGRPEDAGAAIRNTREDLKRAEKERDVADKRALEMCSVQEAEMQARIRAEADNAALLDLLKRTDTHLDVSECCRALRSEVRNAVAQRHPGAALLERVRALEKVRKTAEPFRLACVHPEPWPGKDAGTEFVLACSNADALKGTP